MLNATLNWLVITIVSAKEIVDANTRLVQKQEA